MSGYGGESEVVRLDKADGMKQQLFAETSWNIQKVAIFDL